MKIVDLTLLTLHQFKHRLRSNFHVMKIALILSFVLSFTSLHADSDSRGLGFNPLSQEDLQNAKENWHTVVQVKPNKIGSERLKDHMNSNGLSFFLNGAAHHSEELVVVKGQANALSGILNHADAANLPSSVDNSQLPSFPPIGDQKQLGSCVAWGTTYYQATHEYGLLNGINNKKDLKTVFSPKWTYNNLNGGVDGGLMIFDTYNLLSQNGLVSLERLPYDNNFRTWDLNPADWVSAINYRFAPGQLISGIGGDQQNLQVIKQLLNNGHVLTFGTYINSWQFTKVKADPSVSSNPHAGEMAASWMSGTDGGHCMTIVGYDDNVWIDVNNDGKVDQGEKGAFLIANSWGTDWGNKGFVWVAYDAFLTNSAVVNGPASNRVPLADAMDSYVVGVVPIAPHYTPKLIAQFKLTQTVRDEISVAVGTSDVTSTTPSKIFNSYALVNQGGRLEFDGTAPFRVQTATFALDLTDLVETPAAKQRFYLIVNDNAGRNPTTIQSFSIIDSAANVIVKSKNSIVSIDNATKLVYLDYDPAVPKKPSNPSEPTITEPTLLVTSPFNDQVVTTSVWLAAAAKDPVGIDRVEFYIDSDLFATDKVFPYYALLNPKSLTNGNHVLTVIAYNKEGHSTSKTVDFVVSHK